MAHLLGEKAVKKVWWKQTKISSLTVIPAIKLESGDEPLDPGSCLHYLELLQQLGTVLRVCNSHEGTELALADLGFLELIDSYKGITGTYLQCNLTLSLFHLACV